MHHTNICSQNIDFGLQNLSPKYRYFGTKMYQNIDILFDSFAYKEWSKISVLNLNIDTRFSILIFFNPRSFGKFCDGWSCVHDVQSLGPASVRPHPALESGGWRRPNTPNTCKVTPRLSPKWLQGRHGEGAAHAWHDGPCTLLFQNHHLIRFIIISLTTLCGLCSWWSQTYPEWNGPPPKIYSVQGPFRFVFPIRIEPRTGCLTWPPFWFWFRFGFWPGDLTPHTSESIYDRPFTWQSHNPSDLVSWFCDGWSIMCTWCAIARPLTNLHQTPSGLGVRRLMTTQHPKHT